MASARSLYTTFHHEGPREAYGRSVDWPDHPVCVGRACNVVYRSDKWNEGLQDYTHRIDAKDAEVICDASLRTLGPLPNPAPLARIARPAATVTRLGDAIELTFTPHGGQRRVVSFEAGPGLYDSPELMAWDVGPVHYYAWPVRPGDRQKVVVLRSKILVITPGGLHG